MELLSPDKIQKEKKQSDIESRQRIQKLADEESRLTRFANQAKVNAERTLHDIEQTHTEFVKIKQAERDEIVRDIGNLKVERQQLLAPIDEIKARADAILREAETKLADVFEREKDVELRHERNQEEADKIEELKDEIDIRLEKLSSREKGIGREEARQAGSAANLAEEWLKIHAATQLSNQRTIAVEVREAQVVVNEAANEIRREEQDRRDKELDQKDRAIIDKYNTLIKAVEEHKKNGIITKI